MLRLDAKDSQLGILGDRGTGLLPLHIDHSPAEPVSGRWSVGCLEVYFTAYLVVCLKGCRQGRIAYLMYLLKL